MTRWIIKDGIAVPEPDLLTWSRWYEKERDKYQRVDEVLGIRVSTVFLGLDHSFDHGEPVLWETMVFDDDNGSRDLGQWRFVFQDEAYKFHDDKVKELKKRRDRWPINLATPTSTPGSAATD